MNSYQAMPQRPNCFNANGQPELMSITEVIQSAWEASVNALEWLGEEKKIERRWTGRRSGELPPETELLCTGCGQVKALARFRQIRENRIVRGEKKVVIRYYSKCKACEQVIDSKRHKLKNRRK